jgi:hypothetical protein
MRFLIDFNEIENGDRIWGDLDDAELFFEGNLRVGSPVELSDGAGHWCVGIVTAVDLARRLVRLRIDWLTWRSERYPRNREFPSSYNAQFATDNVENHA